MMRSVSKFSHENEQKKKSHIITCCAVYVLFFVLRVGKLNKIRYWPPEGGLN